MIRRDVALALQKALLGEVTSSLRGVAVEIVASEVGLVFYYDGPITDDQRESADLVHTEAVADLSEDVTLNYDVARVDSPRRLPDHSFWVFRRKASTSQQARMR